VVRTSGFNVRHVMNLTDVEDKIIRRSSERFPNDSPEEAMSKLTRDYGQLFFDDMEAIGNDVNAIKFVWATETIEGMRALIRDLYDEGFAYITDGSVYFSIEKYKLSGKKYGQLLKINSENTSSARIDNDEYDKDNVHDFALWKGAKPGEPAWQFDLDGKDLTGRPGWHIECSVMSVNNLGQPFDIHTGGVDLVFPHHENEIAQSTAGKGNVYAKYFVHNEHILVDGKKMSKSLNNFYTLQDVKEKGFDPLAFRLVVLQSHYRNQSNFTWDNLEAAQNRLKTFQAMADLQFQPVDTERDSWIAHNLDIEKILTAVQDDLNTPQALAHLNNFATEAEEKLINREELDTFNDLLKKLDEIFGLDLTERLDISDEQKHVLEQRHKARLDKDFAKSDQLRDELKKQSIELKDTAHGQIWHRV
jgi:cysteinyl-tRNA synthetase